MAGAFSPVKRVSTDLLGVNSLGTGGTAAVNNRAVHTDSGNYQLTVLDEIVVYTGPGNSIFTLPVAISIRVQYRIVNEGSGKLTIDAGESVIKGSATVDIYPGEDLILCCYADGNWA